MTSRRASRRKGHRARPPRRRPHLELELALAGDDWYGVQPAWCAGLPADVAEAKRLTHDQLISTMGARRTGGVRWVVAGDVDESYRLVEIIASNEGAAAPLTELEGNYVRQLRAHLREYGGLIVVALAPGAPA